MCSLQSFGSDWKYLNLLVPPELIFSSMYFHCKITY